MEQNQTIVKFVRQWLKKRKMMKYRLFVIKEIIETERKYVADIKLLDDFRIELQNQIMPFYLEKIFQNVKDLIEINSKFLKSIDVQVTPNQVIFKVDVADFSKYSIYFIGYNEAIKQHKELLRNDQNYAIFLKNRKVQMRGLELEDFLAKPFQRTPKYDLLFKDLYKNTPRSHPDYYNIGKLYYKFLNINQENNMSMDKNQREMQVKELSNDLNVPEICKKDRMLIFQETATILHNNDQLKVIAYFMNDLLLLEQSKKVFKIVSLDDAQLKDQADTQNYSNLYSIAGSDGIVQFIAENKQAKEKSMRQIERLLKHNVKNNQFPIQVTVLGTREMDNHTFSKHTQYIVEIKIQRVAVKIYVRYSEMANLSHYVRQRFQKLQVEDFSTMKWLQSHDSKIIEHRQILIENLIQAILTFQDSKDDKEILHRLGLPENFNELPKLNQKVDAEIRNNFSSQVMFQKKNLRQVFDKFLDEAQGDRVDVSQVIETIIYNPNAARAGDDVTVEIFITDRQKVSINIKRNTFAYEIIKYIAQMINLQYFRDFKLYEIDQYSNYRLIDDDEQVFKIVEKWTHQGFLTKSYKKIEKLLTRVSVQRIQLRKCYYIEYELEITEIKIDPKRRNLILDYIYEDIQNRVIILSFDEYCLVVALYLIINEKKLDEQQLYDIIPALTLKTRALKEWIQTSNRVYSQMKKEIEKFKQPDEYVASQILINLLRNTSVFNRNVYYVDIDQIEDQELKNLVNVYLALNSRNLSILKPQNKQQVTQLEYNSISEIKSFPNNLKFTYSDQMTKKQQIWSFNTANSYEIKMLINFYSNYQYIK